MPGRKLGRPTAHRNAMLRGLVTYLLENGSVETTLTRAKEVRSMAEKMITLGKKNTLASRRAALAYITKEAVVTKVFNELAPKYEARWTFCMSSWQRHPAISLEEIARNICWLKEMR